MAALFDIDEMFQNCIDRINDNADENNDTVDPCLVKELDALAITRDAKIEQCLRYTKNRMAEQGAIELEISKLQKRSASIERDVTWMKSYIGAVVGAGVKMSFPVGVISWRTSASVEFIDAQIIPAQYKHTKTEVTISKTEIRDAIKSGTSVPGAMLVEKQNIQIK